jgi:hypothetical protein
MRNIEKNAAEENQQPTVKAIVYNREFITLKRALYLLLVGLIIGVLCSFTVVRHEAEPAEEHNLAEPIDLQQPSDLTKEEYAIKIFRYFELFPDMRAFLFRFDHTDIKKVCEQDVIPLSELKRKIGDVEIYPNPENGMTMFVAFENAGAYEMDMLNTNGQGVSHHTIVTEAKINHSLDFTHQIAPGIYYMQMRAGNDLKTEKVLLKGS